MIIRKRDVEHMISEFGDKYQGSRDLFFALACLKQEFQISPQVIAEQVLWSESKIGINAFFVDQHRRNLYLFIFKHGDDHLAFKEPLKNFAQYGLEMIFAEGDSKEKADRFTNRLRSQLHENRSVIDQVILNGVFMGPSEHAQSSEVLQSIREDLEAKKFLIDNFFGRRIVGFVNAFKSAADDSVATTSHVIKTHKYEVDAERLIARESSEGQAMHVGFIKLIDLFKMHEEMGGRLFERNIRSGLSSERPTNKALRKAFHSMVLAKESDPSAFAFFHNGVTIAAEAVEVKGARVTVTEPRLLNGAQTVTSLVRFVADHVDQLKDKSNLKRLEDIRVIGKFVSNASPSFVANVTICNNRQNPVEPWNLRANDELQLAFQEKFRREGGIYYERQEGSFESLSDEEIQEMGIEAYKTIEIRRLAQCFLAVQGEIDKISRLREIFESESYYTNTFRESFLKADIEKILLAYKCQFKVNAVVKDLTEKYPQKYFFLSKCRNLVWGLLVQGLFNDPKMEQFGEKFGQKLVHEVEFVEILKDIGSKRVRFLISEIVDDPRNAALIEQGKFTFLNSKSVFQKCMDTAAEKFEWKKRSIV